MHQEIYFLPKGLLNKKPGIKKIKIFYFVELSLALLSSLMHPV